MQLKERQFDALLGQYYDDLYRFAFWLCKQEHLARDLVQETYLRAWKAIGSLKDPNAAKSWVFTILRREFARQFERKEPPISSLDALEVEPPDAGHKTPDEWMEIDLTRQAMMKLERKYAEPLLLQIIGGFSCEEIADQLNISKSAVMTQLFRARAQVRKQLSRSSTIGNKA